MLDRRSFDSDLIISTPDLNLPALKSQHASHTLPCSATLVLILDLTLPQLSRCTEESTPT